MRTSAKYGLLLALLTISALAWGQSDPGSLDAMAVAAGGGSADQFAVRLAAQYGPLAVAIVLAAVQVGRTIQTTVRDTVATLRQGGIVIRVDLQCPHLEHLGQIQRHLDLEDARREVEATAVARVQAMR